MSDEAPRSPEVIVVPPPVIREQAPRSRTLAWLRRFAKLWGFALFSIFIVYTFRQVALPDEFLDAGALPTLHERYGISADAMASSIKSWL